MLLSHSLSNFKFIHLFICIWKDSWLLSGLSFMLTIIYFAVYIFCLGHAGTTTPWTLILLRLWYPMSDCPPTQVPFQPTGALALWFGLLFLLQASTDSYVTLLHIMALGLNCSGKEGARKGRKERKNGQNDNFTINYVALNFCNLIFFFSYIFSVSHKETIKSHLGNSYLYLGILVRNCFENSFK